MKTTTSLLAALLLVGGLAVSGASARADDVISKTELAPDGYCHIQFPAIRPSTLNTDNPSLKRSGTGDIVDFYGPCNESPTGRDQAWSQQLDFEHRLNSDYSSD